MSTSIEETAAISGQAENKPAKAAQKATRAPRRAPVAARKGKAGKKATPAKKAPKGAKKAKPEARDGSKTARILELLKRPGGVSSKELLKVTGWQPHSLRGFLSGTVRKKMGLTVKSVRGEEGERTYSIEA